MEKLDSFKVDLKGMISDTVSYQWHIDDRFFSAVQGPEIQQGQLDASLQVKRTSGVYELTFGFAGTVKVACDRCMELMDQPVEAEQTLKVKLGDRFEDDGDMVTVPEGDGTLNVAWNLYEFIALEIPIRHVHPQGECPLDAEFEESSSEHETEKPIDPRWNDLRKILDNDKK